MKKDKDHWSKEIKGKMIRGDTGEVGNNDDFKAFLENHDFWILTLRQWASIKKKFNQENNTIGAEFLKVQFKNLRNFAWVQK